MASINLIRISVTLSPVSRTRAAMSTCRIKKEERVYTSPAAGRMDIKKSFLDWQITFLTMILTGDSEM
jgi:outer membrane protease